MFANGCVYYTAVEEDLRGVGDCVEYSQGRLELLIVIVTERLDPSFDFLAACQRREESRMGSPLPGGYQPA